MADAATELTGGCLCGAVRFRADAAPVAVRYCWCRACQHFAAGGATVNVALPRAAVAIEGETRDYESRADSGNRMHRRFCPTCGCHLFSESEARPDLIIVRAGALDDPDLVQPSAVIWASSAPRWACIAADLQQFPAQPPPA